MVNRPDRIEQIFQDSGCYDAFIEQTTTDEILELLEDANEPLTATELSC